MNPMCETCQQCKPNILSIECNLITYLKVVPQKCHALSPSGWDHPCSGVLSPGQLSKERTTWVPTVKPCGKVEQQSVVTRDAKSVNHLGKTEACGHFGVKPWVRVGRLSYIVVNPLLQSFHCLKRDNKHRKISVNQDISPDLPHK